jgi:WS/DGAT/MGAT family acyltransferase
MWLVDGLPDNRWAVINKAHHAMIDGVSGHDILGTLLDRDPNAPAWPVDEWHPRPAPSNREIAEDGASWAARIPARAGGAALRTLADPTAVVRAGAFRMKGFAELGQRAARPTSILNGPVGPHRQWAWARADLASAKAVKAIVGCTINDVVLAVITGGFRQYLAERDDTALGGLVRSLVPVSVRRPDQKGTLGNQVSAVFADLPIGENDPLVRLSLVAQQMDALKASGISVGVESMLSAADFVPPTLVALGARVAVTVGQRMVNTVTTNIPGPQQPMYFVGRRLVEMFPYIPVGQGIRISIGIVSYDGGLYFAATSDADAIPDVDELCSAIEASMAELVEAARAR